MKLIAEVTQNIDVLEEATNSGEKAMYITGPFMEAGITNKNGRSYSIPVMENAVNNYVNDKVNKGCAYGELNHPDGPQINLERACIIIKELNMNNQGQVIGKARITETPMGKIVKGLIESGANLGVSSRGLGSLTKNDKGVMEVQNDFRLVTASDVVADPSAPSAFVKGIYEGAEWIFNDSTGEWAEQITETYSEHQINQARLQVFTNFLQTLKTN